MAKPRRPGAAAATAVATIESLFVSEGCLIKDEAEIFKQFRHYSLRATHCELCIAVYSSKLRVSSGFAARHSVWM